MEISGEPVIEEYISEMLSCSGGVPKPIPQFVCFACPSVEQSLDKLMEHCQNQTHIKAFSGK